MTTLTPNVATLTCRICRRTEKLTFRPLCRWPEPDLCMGCSSTADVLARWIRGCRWRNRAALFREAEKRLFK